MVNPPRKKGTAAESALVAHLRVSGFPHAERSPLRGNKDRGDVTGIPGVVLEMKDKARYAISEWMAETEAEIANADALTGALIVKPNGIGLTSVGRWWAILPVDRYLRLMREAGHGAPADWPHQGWKP